MELTFQEDVKRLTSQASCIPMVLCLPICIVSIVELTISGKLAILGHFL